MNAHSGAQDAARNPGVSPFDLTFNHETALFQVVTVLFQIIVAQ
jgi:hypothetical protein